MIFPPPQHLTPRPLAPARAWIALLGLVAAVIAGCASTPVPVEPPRPRTITLDYRFGWYHTAAGTESVLQIAQRYQRSVDLVAKLNRVNSGDRPPAGTALYIPPNNDPDYVRYSLSVINEFPERVPTKPWIPPPTGSESPLSVKPSASAQLKVKKADSYELVEPTSTRVASATGRSAAAASPASIQSPPRQAKATASPRATARATVAKASISPSASATSSAPDQFIWPAKGKVVTPFSDGWSKACHGVEISASEGSPVRASRGGKVRLAQDFPGYGKLVLIDHMDGLSSVYGYLNGIQVRKEQWVDQGQQIASVGRPRSTGRPMLFFQVRENGRKVDPMNYLN